MSSLERPLLWLLFAAGVLLRVASYVTRPAFWSDEAALAMNIVDRPISEVARPFEYQQAAPYFFALGQKLLTVGFGASEYVLRLWPLLAGIAFLPVVYLLTLRLAGRQAALLALAVTVCGKLLIYYSSELKPYANDALISALLVLAFEQVLRRGERALLPLTVGGVLAPWLSLPSIFVLAAIGFGLLAGALRRRASTPSLLLLAGIGAVWLISFGLHYQAFLRLNGVDATILETYWMEQDGFGPPLTAAGLRWYAGKLGYVFFLFDAPFSYGARYVAGALWLAGLCVLWRRQPALPFVFVLPLPLALGASAFHAYVVNPRLLMFFAPLAIVPAAIGLSAVAAFRRPYTRAAAALTVAALCFAGALDVLPELRLQRAATATDIRSLVDYLRERIQSEDQVFVEQHVAWSYEYYAHRAGLRRPLLLPNALDIQPDRVRWTLRRLAGSRRVWAIVPAFDPAGPSDPDAITAIEQAHRLVVGQLSSRGKRLDAYDGNNVMLYLYDLSGSRPQIESEPSSTSVSAATTY